MEQKNVLRVFVGSNVAETTDGTLIDSYTDLNDGAIAIVGYNNTVTNDPTSDGEKWRFVWRNGTQLIYSPWITGKNILKCYKRSYTGSNEQISYVGHNGSSGSLELQNSKLYLLRLAEVAQFKTFGDKIHYKTFEYKSDASASQAEVMQGLYESALMNLSKEAEDTVKVERTVAGTSLAALTGSATIYKLTKGLTTVYTYTKAAAGDATLTASTASVTDGTIFQTPSTSAESFTFTAVALGSSAGSHVIWINDTSYVVADAGTNAQNATAIVAAINAGTQAKAVAATAAVTITMNDDTPATVMVLSSDDDSTFANVAVTYGDTVPVNYYIDGTTSAAATFELDYPWVGETCYFYEGTTVGSTCGIITATGNYGLKFSGLPRTNFEVGVMKYLKNRFKLMMTVDGTTSTSTITYTTTAKEGAGTWKEIAELEWFASGNEINYGKRVKEPGDKAMRSTVVEDARYETINISFIDNEYIMLTGGQPASVQEIILAFYKDSAQGDAMITNLNKSAYIVLSAFSA